MQRRDKRTRENGRPKRSHDVSLQIEPVHHPKLNACSYAKPRSTALRRPSTGISTRWNDAPLSR
jgi:hypothetical protein